MKNQYIVLKEITYINNRKRKKINKGGVYILLVEGENRTWE